MGLVDVELFHVAAKNLRGRRFRSFLTILGVVIGIAAIVALIAVGEGLNQSVSEQFQSLGTDTLFVLPGGGMMESMFAKLSDDDADTIEEVRGVDFAVALYVSGQQIEFKDKKYSVTIIGIEPEKIDKLSVIGMADVAEGRELTENDTSGIVLGSNFSSKTIKEEISLKQSIEIDGKKFKVVGVLDEATNNFARMFNSAIIMNSEELKAISDTEISPMRIIVNILPSEEMEEAKQRISDHLEDDHGKKDFQIMDLQQISDIAGSVVGMISLVLIGIAAISLLVGGIGIMNTMLMSVMERTKEVGLMKAVGATTPRIISIFVVEAGLIGLVGGLIGLVLGIGMASVVSIVAGAADLPLKAVVTPELIVGALAFSMVVGMIAGVYPAKRAASIDPVEALRFE